MNVEWNNDLIYKLIDLYREKKILWDTNLKEYKDKTKKYAAWREIAQALNIDKEAVERKVKILITQFRRELKTKSASGGNEGSKWFAFNKLLFLKNTGKVTKAEELETPQESSDDEVELQPLRKKKKKITERNELVEAVQALLAKTERDDCATFTSHLKTQMKELETEQKYIAQKLISDVMFLARTNRLNYDTCVINPGVTPSNCVTNQGVIPSNCAINQGVISSNCVTNQGVILSNCVTNQGVTSSSFVTNQGVIPSSSVINQSVIPFKQTRARYPSGMPSSTIPARYAAVQAPEATIQGDAIGSTNLLNESKYSPCFVQTKESDVADVTHKTELLDDSDAD